MAKAEMIFFQGKCKWARVLLPDVEFKNWNIHVYLDAKSVAKFRELQEEKDGVSGILNELRNDEDGDYVIFRRPMFKNFGKGDEPLQPPEVIDHEGRPMPKTIGIGNGSDVTIKCELYTYTKPYKKGFGKAFRMTGVKVDNLVPFERSDLKPNQEKMVKGLDEQPPQTTEGW